MQVIHKIKYKPNMGLSPHHILSLYHVSTLLLLASYLSMIFLGAIAPNNTVFADTITEEHSFGVTVDYSLDIILSNNALTIPILPNEDGQFGRSSTSVYVDTNNAAGYTLTLQSNTDTLTSKQTNSKIDPLTNPTTCTNESDDTCDTFPVNQWGYRIGDTGAYLSATNIVNNPVRLAQTSTVTMTTDPAATLYFGAKINTDKPTGIYDGVELTFIATANIQKYNVTLLPTTGISSIQLDNNAPCTNTTTGCVYALEKDSQHTLTANVASNHKFTSWANSTTYGSFSNTTTPTTTFTVGEGDATITASGEVSGLNGMTSCPSGTTELTDTRNNKKYNVATLNDGRCWMLSDLQLEAGTVLSSADSNFNSGSYTIPSSWSNTYDTGAIYVGSTYYYNYYTATAGTISGSNNQTEATQDICPSGWKIPSQAEWQALITAYSGNASSVKTALNLSFSGSYGGSLYNTSYGYFWSTTADGTSNRYFLRIGSSSVDATTNVTRNYAVTIRCVLK